VRSRLRAAIFPGEDATGLPDAASVTDAFVELAVPECLRNGDIVTIETRSPAQSRA
jgi:hypothetical protein